MAIRGHRYPKKAAYAVLFLCQTVAAIALIALTLPIFLRMIGNLGTPQELSVWTEITILVDAAFLQCCYWTRYLWVPVYAPFKNVFAGHIFQFLSRTSFLFGGAMFSTIFFRHIPALGVLPAGGQGFVKTAILMLMLFALFCYSLELERLGKSIEWRGLEKRPIRAGAQGVMEFRQQAQNSLVST